jgi:hypothetical protein
LASARLTRGFLDLGILCPFRRWMGHKGFVAGL